MKISASPIRTVISNPLGRHCYFGWPTVARLKDGRLAVAASGYRISHLCPFGKSVISFSEDEGKTWSIPSVVFNTQLDDRDSGVVPFGESGLMVTSFNNGFKEMRSYLDSFEGRPDMYRYAESYIDLVALFLYKFK